MLKQILFGFAPTKIFRTKKCSALCGPMWPMWHMRLVGLRVTAQHVPISCTNTRIRTLVGGIPIYSLIVYLIVYLIVNLYLIVYLIVFL